MKNLYKKLLILAVCISFMNCNKEKKESENLPVSNIVVVKRIKSEYLNRIRLTHTLYKKTKFSEGDSIVVLVDFGESYVETRRQKNESINNFFVYNKRNNLMIASGTKFYDTGINLFRKYNKEGRVIEERDTNKGFTFSAYDLIEKIKKTYKINLNNGKEDRSVHRGLDEKTNKMIYHIKYDINNGLFKYITVDGLNGYILSSGSGQLRD